MVNPCAEKFGQFPTAALLGVILLYVGTGKCSQAKTGNIMALTSHFPSLKDLRPALPDIHFLSTIALYIVACSVLVFGRIANLIAATLLWLEAD